MNHRIEVSERRGELSRALNAARVRLRLARLKDALLIVAVATAGFLLLVNLIALTLKLLPEDLTVTSGLGAARGFLQTFVAAQPFVSVLLLAGGLALVLAVVLLIVRRPTLVDAATAVDLENRLSDLLATVASLPGDSTRWHPGERHVAGLAERVAQERLKLPSTRGRWPGRVHVAIWVFIAALLGGLWLMSEPRGNQSSNGRSLKGESSTGTGLVLLDPLERRQSRIVLGTNFTAESTVAGTSSTIDSVPTTGGDSSTPPEIEKNDSSAANDSNQTGQASGGGSPGASGSEQTATAGNPAAEVAVGQERATSSGQTSTTSTNSGGSGDGSSNRGISSGVSDGESGVTAAGSAGLPSTATAAGIPTTGGVVETVPGQSPPPWQLNDWPSHRAAGLSRVDGGSVPDEYRDLVRSYFSR